MVVPCDNDTIQIFFTREKKKKQHSWFKELELEDECPCQSQGENENFILFFFLKKTQLIKIFHSDLEK